MLVYPMYGSSAQLIIMSTSPISLSRLVSVAVISRCQTAYKSMR